MVNPKTVEKGLEVVNKVTWNLMNDEEKKLYMIGGAINAFGTIFFLVLLAIGWRYWWIGLIICWIIGMPIIWNARAKAVARVFRKR